MEVPQPVFYYDLGDPECYLAAERLVSEPSVVPEWEPVLGWQPVNGDRAALERRAAALGLQPLRWPAEWPPDSREAMLAATYAKQIGRGVAFSLAAFRQTFAAGRDPGDTDTVLIAGAACEMHPAALLQALSRRGVARALADATEQASQAGVKTVPAIRLGGEVFAGLEGFRSASGTSASGTRVS